MIDFKKEIASGGVSRHETFTPRYGWLKKGFDAVTKDSKIFSAIDAIERLGVGKNMVRSIRSWCLAFHLIEPCKEGQKGAFAPTIFGKKLLSDNDGWDPFLEDISSIWLLHWNLFIPPFELSSWPLAFNYCSLQTFDIKQLSKVIISSARKYENLSGRSGTSFTKDASCILRMYSDSYLDQNLGTDCPFNQIDLIRPTEEKNHFRFIIGEKSTLPSLIFLAACFSYADLTQPKQRTLSFHKILYEFNSPGIVYKITETEAGRMLDEAAKQIDSIEFVESMGNRQLQFDKDPSDLFLEALSQYYKK
jgi:hypothetical protein